MSQQRRIGKTATTVHVNPANGMTEIWYHQTCVVKFDDKKIILNSGGWRTATTKTRMNQAANQFNLGFYVEQHNGSWNVHFNDKVLDFQDGMTIKRGA
jgi:hypothetical protein